MFIDALLQNPLIALFAAIAIGLIVGQIAVRGITLGSSGVLFAALLFGHFGYTMPVGVGTFGLILFVYCVGVGAGGRFFSALARKGGEMALLSSIIVVSGALIAWLCAWILDLPADLTAGIFAGSLTSTPALAAATDVLGQSDNAVTVGYGIAYPFGVIGVVLFVQLLPRLLKADLDAEARQEESSHKDNSHIRSTVVEVTNPNLFGQNISESTALQNLSCQITRVVHKGELVPLRYSDQFNPGIQVMIVGRADHLGIATELLGKPSSRKILIDTDRERRQLIVTEKQATGKTLNELNPLRDFNIVISRVSRLGFTFVPTGDTLVERNDMLTAVGQPDDLQRFATFVGHRPIAADETDILSLAIGITLGIIAGLATLSLSGAEIRLGLAGGPLVVGLILGHFGRIGRIIGHIPRPTRILLQELGLVLFLADAGARGGRNIVETLHQYGFSLFLAGALITLIPLALAYPIARRILGLNNLQALGGICGGMTSTPALGALSTRTDAQLPIVSYAAAYPVALILMTVFAKLLIDILRLA